MYLPKLGSTLPIAIILFIRCIVQVLLYRAGFVAFTADEFSRTLIAAHWARHPQFIWSGLWLPFHFYLLGLSLKVYWHLIWTPRFITIAWGLINICLIYLLGKLLSDRRDVGIYCAILLAVNPVHIWLSSTPLSEMPFLVCWLAALCGVAAFFRTERSTYLIVSAVSLAFANGIRYEGWWISALFALVVLGNTAHYLQRKRATPQVLITSFVALIVVSIVPLAWLVGNAVELGNPFAFARGVRDYNQLWYGREKAYLVYATTFLWIDPLASIAVCGGIIWVLATQRTNGILAYVVLTVAPLLIYLVLQQGQVEPTFNHQRYQALYIFVTYPLAMLFLLRLVQRVPWRRVAGLMSVIVLLVLSGRQFVTTFDFPRDPVLEGYALGQHINILRGTKQEPALVELSYWHYLAAPVGANDLDNILYDRAPVASRSTTSAFVQAPSQAKQCVVALNIRLVAARTLEVKQAVEQQLTIEARVETPPYTIYVIAPSVMATTVKPDECTMFSRP